MAAVEGGSKMGKIALGAAAVIALAAVGITVFRSADSKPATAPAPSAMPQQTPDQAIAQLEARLKANPDDVEGWQLLGWSFFETGRYAEAATAYKRATTLAPNNAALWSSLGEALALSTDKEEMPADAAAAFRKAVGIDPKDARARYFLAAEKDIKGDHKDALEDWFALLADTPAGAPWEADLKRTITQVGEREKIEVASRLAAIKPAPAQPGSSAPHPGATMAGAAIPGPTRDQMQAASALPPSEQAAMVEGMLASLEGKLKANPQDTDRWIMLMRSRMTLNEPAKAAAAYRAALAANPAGTARITAAAQSLGVPGV